MGDGKLIAAAIAIGVTIVLVLITRCVNEDRAEACEAECASEGLRANVVRTRHGVSCICTPPGDSP